MKITGLDKLTKQLEEAKRAIADLDGEFGSVRFDPEDPASIETAIRNMESMLDERTAGYENNPIVGPLVEQMKETYRQGILKKAAEARLEKSGR